MKQQCHRLMDHKQVKCKSLDFQIQEPEMAFSKSKGKSGLAIQIIYENEVQVDYLFPASVFQTHGPREEAVSSF
jgi:hypothetical protein